MAVSVILIVDDEEMNRNLLEVVLTKNEYKLMFAENGQEALDFMRSVKIDLVLMDIMMPVMNGVDAVKAIKNVPQWETVPIIMLTALSDKSSIKEALSAGANDYLTKPFDILELQLRIHNMLKIKQYNDMLKDSTLVLEHIVREKTYDLECSLKEIKESEFRITEVLGRASEYKDNETGQHIKRMGKLSRLLASHLGFRDEELEKIEYAAMMHDVGKIGIPDNILKKPGKLTTEEFEIMKDHTIIGYDILAPYSVPLLKTAAIIALSHHEKYDGSGYPKGLKGEEIPLIGRIVAVADVFDALMSPRPYKPPFSLAQTKEILQEGKGNHFDPYIVDLFFEKIDEVMEIWENFNA